MKRSASELDLEEFLRPTIVLEMEDNDNQSSKEDGIGEFRVQKSRICGETESLFGVHVSDLTFSFVNQEMIDNFSSCGDGLTESLVWYQSVAPKHSTISATIDSPSLICGPATSSITFGCTASAGASPTSAHKLKSGDNQARGTSSNSSREQSDDDDIEIETISCGPNMDRIDVRRVRRMVSNRESAKRSRSRKQAHLVDLELLVNQLGRENASLCKQFMEADQLFSEASTDNRVLKSDVEALRVKVKLAENMVARSSLACGLNHRLQSYSSSLQLPSTQDLITTPDILSTLSIRGDEASYIGMPTLGLEGVDTCNGGAKHRLSQNTLPLQRIESLEQIQNRFVSDTMSCLSEIWP